MRYGKLKQINNNIFLIDTIYSEIGYKQLPSTEGIVEIEDEISKTGKTLKYTKSLGRIEAIEERELQELLNPVTEEPVDPEKVAMAEAIIAFEEKITDLENKVNGGM